ncbi:hypothetical protein ColTof3_13433 [Colletotrichum tofieldiae]|nr:hypothetical protein ColTof3_13433 [Colletotrichum tofieldiae]
MPAIQLPNEVRTALDLLERHKAAMGHFGSYTRRNLSSNPSTNTIFGITIVVIIVLLISIIIWGKNRARQREERATNRYMAVVAANEGGAEPGNGSTYGEGTFPGPQYGTCASEERTADSSCRDGAQLGPPPPAYSADISNNGGSHCVSSSPRKVGGSASELLWGDSSSFPSSGNTMARA